MTPTMTGISLPPCFPEPMLVGDSAVIQDLRSKISLIARSEAAVLIVGESGTGKEVVARLIHAERKHTPFLAVNCAALPKDVIENELFGHEKGAFTGALSKHMGCFELANGGTLFLDEIAEMHPQTQAKLLRAIESKTFWRLGGKEEISVNTRILAATNKDITAAIESGELREDLFYRLSVFEIWIPPLRERKEDIPELLRQFLSLFCSKYNKPPKRVDSDCLQILAEYHWPGNIRELKNLAERLTLVSQGESINSTDLPPKICKRIVSSGSLNIPVGVSLKAAEQSVILKTLDSVKNNKSKAARILGVSRKTLHEKLKSFNESRELSAIPLPN